jgi:hypothetical protein
MRHFLPPFYLTKNFDFGILKYRKLKIEDVKKDEGKKKATEK